MSSPFAIPSTWDAVVGAYDQHLTPVFGEFAERALALARASAGDRLLDVAAGPGTLALRAALYADVSTIDFSPEMVTRLRANAAAQGFDVDARVGDGQALPWADGTFDVTFSMFGLIFFPDPAKGLAEMARVTRPGGRVTVGSWRPMDPRLQAVVQVLGETLGMPAPGPQPFSEEDDIRARFAAAGLRDVAVHTPSAHVDYPSDTALLDALFDYNAVLLLMRRTLGEGWAPIEAAMRATVRERWGTGPQRFAFDAWITVGTK